MIAQGARSLERGQTVRGQQFNAPLFRTLVDDIKARDRSVVLDLGSARTQTVALFGRYRCRLEIADVARGLVDLNASSDVKLLENTAEALLPAPRVETTDVVFCWDLLNYLKRPALRAIMSRIALRARRGTLVHALIVYSETHMPSRPGNFVPQEDCSLTYSAASGELSPAPRYSPEDLGECLPAYSIDRAMLLSNGMQEFLFRY